MGSLVSSLKEFDTLPKRLKHFSEKFPEKELFIFYEDKTRQSYCAGEIYDLASKFAARLRQRGLKKDDVILNTLRNSIERVITDVGIVFAGCIPSNGQMVMAGGEDLLNSALVSRARAIIVCPREDDPRWKVLQPFVTDSNTASLFTTMDHGELPDLTTAILVERDNSRGFGINLMEELRTSTEPGYVAELCPDDIVCLMTTSGSTGLYKLVPHTHRWMLQDFLEDLQGVSQALDDMVDEGCFFMERPLGWLGGYPLATWAIGCQRVLFDSFNEMVPKNVAQLKWWIIQQERCTGGAFVPLDLGVFVENILASGDTPSHRMKAIFIGGQPVQQLPGCFSIAEEMFNVYGLTEVGLGACCSVTATSPPVEDFCVGKPGNNTKVRIMNDDGQESEPREIGNIHLKGPTVFTGYFSKLDDQTSTRKSFTPDGWYKTDDLGFLNEHGDLHVIGRKSDAILNGTTVVHPTFIERILKRHPQVEEVFVVPVSDPVVFQTVCACVLPKPGQEVSQASLQTFCEKEIVTDYMEAKTKALIPKFFMVLEDLPRTQTGKPDKVEIKKRVQARFETE